MMQTLMYSGNSSNNSERQNSVSTTSESNNTSELDKENSSSPFKSDFERLIYRLKNDPLYRKEIITDKLIGFYKIGNEIGTGNFSQVRLGLHLLTRGKTITLSICVKM
jgi:serine/threonine-protein kinase NIM1